MNSLIPLCKRPLKYLRKARDINLLPAQVLGMEMPTIPFSSSEMRAIFWGLEGKKGCGGLIILSLRKNLKSSASVYILHIHIRMTYMPLCNDLHLYNANATRCVIRTDRGSDIRSTLLHFSSLQNPNRLTCIHVSIFLFSTLFPISGFIWIGLGVGVPRNSCTISIIHIQHLSKTFRNFLSICIGHWTSSPQNLFATLLYTPIIFSRLWSQRFLCLHDDISWVWEFLSAYHEKMMKFSAIPVSVKFSKAKFFNTVGPVRLKKKNWVHFVGINNESMKKLIWKIFLLHSHYLVLRFCWFPDKAQLKNNSILKNCKHAVGRKILRWPICDD